MLCNKQVIIAAVIGCLLYTPISILATSWATPYLKASRGFDNATASLTASYILMGSAVGGPISGFLAMNYLSKKTLIKVGSLLSTVIILKLIYFPHENVKVVQSLYFLLGLSSSAQVLIFAIAHDNTQIN